MVTHGVEFVTSQLVTIHDNRFGAASAPTLMPNRKWYASR